jgi:hypothetical protein
MVNLHIGGAISVFFICIGLLACDHWFNRNEANGPRFSETDGNHLEAPSELVIAPPKQFFFVQQPGTNVIEKATQAVWFPRNSWVEEANDSWAQRIRPPKFAMDGQLFTSDFDRE